MKPYAIERNIPWMLVFTMLLIVLKGFGKFPFAWGWTLAPLWAPMLGASLVFLATLFVVVMAIGAWVAFLWIRDLIRGAK